MWSVVIDTKKAQTVPSSLKDWTSQAHKGPRTLVAELCQDTAAEQSEAAALAPCYSLKEWTSELGPHAMVAHLMG